MEDYRSVGARLSNWGRWGPGDQRGTLNFLTPEVVAGAAREIATGRVFELSIPIQQDSPDWNGRVGRGRPLHFMSYLPSSGDVMAADGMFGCDDWISMPLQGGTQWDALSHVGYDDAFYNGVPITAVRADGAHVNSVDASMPGMVGRGVLLDIARLEGRPWLPSGHAITVADLDAAEAAQGVMVRSGDCLLVRTGWRAKALREGWDGWLGEEPGLSLEVADWLASREVAAVASDNHSLEVRPSPGGKGALPLHCVLLRDMGMPIGEIFDLEALSADCVADGRWSFFLSAPPLRVTAAVGSPTSPIAVK